jgi:aspartate carbamoyltransferase catalytic subunit
MSKSYGRIEDVHISYKRMYDELNQKNEKFETILQTLKGSDELSSKNLVSIDNLSMEDIKLIFRMTWPFKAEFLGRDQKKIPLLKGKSVINFFFETSTRTKISFELAGKHLSADTINMSGSSSSMSKKGETLIDTVRTLNAMNADLLILRHSAAGTPMMICDHLDCPVISAGDGWHEHPTQALLDAFTICENLGTIKDKTVCIVGDILHSRVAGSLIRIVKKMNGKVRLIGPPTMIPEKADEVFGVEVYYDIDEGLKGADVIYSLRVQLERAAAGFIPTVREYSKNYCINPERVKLAKDSAIIMHPGPVNREVDLRTEIMEHERCRVEDQVTNGFCTRMALLYLMIKGNPGLYKEKKKTSEKYTIAKSKTEEKLKKRIKK